MNTTEFSNEFDLLYNNIASNQAPGLDSYEKSVFLTKAQEEIILALYSDKNSDLQSFEKTEELRRYLDSLIETDVITLEAPTNLDTTLSSTSRLATLNDEVWFITYEALKAPSNAPGCLKDKELEVIPVTQDEFHRIKNNPFRGAINSRALRLDYSKTVSDSGALLSRVEIVLPKEFVRVVTPPQTPYIPEYIIRYIKKPNPIILPGVTLSIDGKSLDSTKTSYECELHPALHRLILDRAVRLAVASFTQNLQ